MTATPKAPRVTTGLKDLLWHRYLRRPYKLYTYDYGGGTAHSPVIIMLHGLASSSANWDPLIPLLKQQYRCITIDLAGFGNSPKPQWYQYTMDEHLRCLHAAVQGLHIKQPYILLGHSLGGLLATRYARQHARQVSRLILLSPPVYNGTIDSKRARQRTSVYLRAYRFIRTHKRVTYDNFLRMSRILPLAKFLVLNADSWRPFMRSLEQCVENQTLVQDIKDVKAPVEVFYGIFDEVVVPYNVRQLAKIRDVTLYPLKVNHMVGKRYAAAVAKVLTRPTSQA